MSWSTLSPIPMSEGLATSCDNCEWRGVAEDCNEIKDPSERLNAGSVVPAGECPDCGCLAYVDPELDGDKVPNRQAQCADCGTKSHSDYIGQVCPECKRGIIE